MYCGKSQVRECVLVSLCRGEGRGDLCMMMVMIMVMLLLP